MTLFDVKEKDENGELLKFNPRKAAEMQAVLAGQAVPIITKGIFLYEHDSDPSIAAGDLLYSADTGEITDSGTAGTDNVVGLALGPSKAVGSKYQTLIKLDCAASAVDNA
jgi:predicted RecA/RadA family phage recombinase